MRASVSSWYGACTILLMRLAPAPGYVCWVACFVAIPHSSTQNRCGMRTSLEVTATPHRKRLHSELWPHLTLDTAARKCSICVTIGESCSSSASSNASRNARNLVRQPRLSFALHLVWRAARLHKSMRRFGRYRVPRALCRAMLRSRDSSKRGRPSRCPPRSRSPPRLALSRSHSLCTSCENSTDLCFLCVIVFGPVLALKLDLEKWAISHVALMTLALRVV